MKARRTHNTNVVHRLPGGTEDNDLWTYYLQDESERPVICSVWVPSAKERQRIAAGENVRLMVWGERTPPVAMDLTDEPLGKSPDAPDH
jgi:hypothetical protein